jgi:hypothetical protein
MDQWLGAVERDTRDVPLAQKLVEDKPATVADKCTEGFGAELGVPSEVCDEVVDIYSSPRIQAGMPFTDDVMKCQLRPLSAADYLPARFTDDQWARLQTAFPTGVCDYAEPGVDAVKTVPWLTYEGGPGGQPLGDPPGSEPFTAAAVAGVRHSAQAQGGGASPAVTPAPAPAPAEVAGTQVTRERPGTLPRTGMALGVLAWSAAALLLVGRVAKNARR